MSTTNWLTRLVYIPVISILLLFSNKISATPITAQIIDGTRAPASSFSNVTPIIVDSESICTGTLVSKDTVLTAAHCFYDDRNNKVVADNEVQLVFGNQVFQSSKIYIHPSYSSRSEACAESEFDAALIRFSNSELLPAGVVPTNLGRTLPAKGQQLTLVGYGIEGTGSKGEQGIFPPAGLLNFGSTVIERISSTYIQWDFDAGESNTASGDSGGPSFSELAGVSTLVGITCGGTGNSQFGTDSYNTRIDQIASWIDSIAGSSASPSAPQYLGSAFLQASTSQSFSTELIFGGSAPDNIQVFGLPAGLLQNDRFISGTPLVSGQFTLNIFASNIYGSSNSQISLSIADFRPELNLKSILLQFDDTSRGSDFLIIKGKLVLPENFRPKAKRTEIQIGRYKRSCKLDSSGGCGSFDFFQLKAKLKSGKFNSSNVGFSLQLVNSRLFKALASLGFPETDFASAGEIVTLPVEIKVDQIVYRSTVNLKFRESDLRWVLAK